MAVAKSTPQANQFALFVQQQANISTNTERRAGLSAIAEHLVTRVTLCCLSVCLSALY